MKKIIFAGFVYFSSAIVLAGPIIDAKVIYVGTNSNNVVFFGLDKVIEEPGCPSEQVVIPPDSPIREKILSLALAAKASGSVVQVKTKGCYIGKPSILSDASDWGWLYIK